MAKDGTETLHGAETKVGVLALQGDFREHVQVLADLGANVVLVRRPTELAEIAGLIIPGGESSVIDKLARNYGLFKPLRAAITSGLPVYGTCAGLIMLADRLIDAIQGQETLGGLDIVVRRNAFGPQTESFETELHIPEIGGRALSATFIRAPVVTSVGPAVRVLAKLNDGRVVAVEQGNLLGTSFHPELNGEHRIHQYFLQKVAAYADANPNAIGSYRV